MLVDAHIPTFLNLKDIGLSLSCSFLVLFRSWIVLLLTLVLCLTKGNRLFVVWLVGEEERNRKLSRRRFPLSWLLRLCSRLFQIHEFVLLVPFFFLLLHVCLAFYWRLLLTLKKKNLEDCYQTEDRQMNRISGLTSTLYRLFFFFLPLDFGICWFEKESEPKDICRFFGYEI